MGARIAAGEMEVTEIPDFRREQRRQQRKTEKTI
jgi:hypothetical protein